MPARSKSFPALQSCINLMTYSLLPTDELESTQVYDVEFYPFATNDNEQIFAVVYEEQTAVFRTKLGEDPEILRWFRDEQKPEARFNSLAWTRDPITRKPWLCVAGSSPKHIKVLDIETGELARTLIGHGNNINELVVSPISTDIVFSASDDHTIRAWNLHPRHKKQPCCAIFAGEGHKQPIMSMHISPNGRWLLSGGLDTVVCLWTVPNSQEWERKANSDDPDETPEPLQVFYPHFFSKEVHSNYVDSLAFYNDLIISRDSRNQIKVPGGKAVSSIENEILIWKIEGFDPDDEPPDYAPVPLPGKQSRSSFPHEKGCLPFARLATLHMPDTSRFFLRFGLLHAPGLKPILAMGNEKSQMCFWDLQRLEGEILEEDTPAETRKPRGRPKKGLTEQLHRHLLFHKDDLKNSDTSTDSMSNISSARSSSTTVERASWSIIDPFRPLEPHLKTTIPSRIHDQGYCATSQIAWSPDGTWMVGVHDHGVVSVWHRDKGDTLSREPKCDTGDDDAGDDAEDEDSDAS